MDDDFVTINMKNWVELKDKLDQIATGVLTGLPEHCAETSHMRSRLAKEALQILNEQ